MFVPALLAAISFVLFIIRIDFIWVVKIPAGILAYWFFFWELPLILFQNPKNLG